MSFFSDVGNAVGKAAAVVLAAGAIAALTKKPVTRNTGSDVFPKDLNDKYYFTIDFYAYARQSLMAVGELPSAGTLKLPLPTNLSDSYQVSYEPQELGTALGGGAEAIAGMAGGNSLLQGAASMATSIAGSAINKTLSGPLGALASAGFGATTNPFMTILFKSPNYKEYSFSWRLYPRNQAEMASLLNIVSTIRYHMLPGQFVGSGGSVFSYPSLVKCSAITKAGTLYPFKYGVIKNATFNYAPDGAPTFHRDGQPSAVDVKIDIQEVEYFLKEDF